MQLTSLLTAIGSVALTSALPVTDTNSFFWDVNPFLGKNYFANAHYAGELNQTVASFLAQNDTLNAARTRTVQKVGTFVWITSVASLSNIDTTIAAARAEQWATRKPQIVELVVYDIPDRDCSGGQSSGEFSLDDNGLDLYKHTFIDPFAAKLAAAPDLSFALILEPDSLGNIVTNQAVPFCANASSGYLEGIAYSIAKFQLPNVFLYVDAAHGGWLGWDANLAPAGTGFFISSRTLQG
jgi:cellulose 1,4-beta-cellobiosidase